MTNHQKTGIGAVVGAAVLEFFVSYYPAARAGMDSLKQAGGVGALLADAVLSHVSSLALIALGLIWLFWPGGTAGEGQSPAGSGPVNTGGSATATGNTVNIYNASAPDLPPAKPINPPDPPPDERVPPRVSVSVEGGFRVRVTVTNTGGPFKLRAVLKLLSASRGPIDQPGPHYYYHRQVGGGEDGSPFDVAHLDDTWHRVNVWAEGTQVIQSWDLGTAPLTFTLGMIFQDQQGKQGDLHFERLCAVGIQITALRDGLKAMLVPWEEEARSQTGQWFSDTEKKALADAAKMNQPSPASQPIPDGEFEVTTKEKRGGTWLRLRNLKAERKTGYSMLVVDVQLWSETLNGGSGGFGPFGPFFDMNKPIQLIEASGRKDGRKDVLDFHDPTFFELVRTPGVGPWHLWGANESLPLRDGIFKLTVELRWNEMFLPMPYNVRLATNKSVKESSFVSYEPSGDVSPPSV